MTGKTTKRKGGKAIEKASGKELPRKKKDLAQERVPVKKKETAK